jgi:sugar phosphate isomerase/epimerase
MANLITHWKHLGCPIISTETGTLNEKSEWADSPYNVTEKAYQECRGAFEKWAKLAAKHGATISIEPYWRNIIDSPERAERLFRELHSSSFRLVMDPCNYYRKEDLPQMDAMLQNIFQRVGRQTVVAHAKDVKAAPDGTDLPASGLGVLNYPLYLKLLAQLNRKLDLVIEHLTLEDVPRARDYVLSQMEKI